MSHGLCLGLDEWVKELVLLVTKGIPHEDGVFVISSLCTMAPS